MGMGSQSSPEQHDKGYHECDSAGEIVSTHHKNAADIDGTDFTIENMLRRVLSLEVSFT
jgi:hypothetical protein